MKILRLGITGGLGSGKTTAARFFSERGGRVFDADAEAKLILQRHEPTREAVIKAFGAGVLNEQKEIDFGLLAEKAFATPEQQRQLNEIVHPEVILKARRDMTSAEREGIALFVVDVPLLFEAGLEQYLDYTVVVVANEELRIKRASARGTLTADDIRRRTQLQLSDDERIVMTDFVIDNNGSLAELHEQLQDLYDILTGNVPS